MVQGGKKILEVRTVSQKWEKSLVSKKSHQKNLRKMCKKDELK